MKFEQPSPKSGTSLFRRAKFVKKFLSWCESMSNFTVTPTGWGSFTSSDNSAILDLTGLKREMGDTVVVTGILNGVPAQATIRATRQPKPL